MRVLAKPLALVSLAATIVPPLLFLTGTVGEGAMKTTMLFATIAWFIFAPFWLKEND
jgi:hypothetical protein